MLDCRAVLSQSPRAFSAVEDGGRGVEPDDGGAVAAVHGLRLLFVSAEQKEKLGRENLVVVLVVVAAAVEGENVGQVELFSVSTFIKGPSSLAFFAGFFVLEIASICRWTRYIERAI